MMKNPKSAKKWDRLAAFFGSYPLSVRVMRGDASIHLPALFLLGERGTVDEVVLAVRGQAEAHRKPPLAVVEVDFGGTRNPLLNALADTLPLGTGGQPALAAIAQAFLLEAEGNRCGSGRALDRLGEVLLLLVLRAAIEGGTAEPGLLAGLAHADLHRVLVAMHEAPAHPWDVEELADIAGMSRSRFMALFPRVVGTTPKAYLTRWRLEFGRRELQKSGTRVKAAARRAGFGSAEAFSRAFHKEFGAPPREMSAAAR